MRAESFGDFARKKFGYDSHKVYGHQKKFLIKVEMYLHKKMCLKMCLEIGENGLVSESDGFCEKAFSSLLSIHKLHKASSDDVTKPSNAWQWGKSVLNGFS